MMWAVFGLAALGVTAVIIFLTQKPRSGPRAATAKQKEFARQLGIQHNADVTVWELSALIDEALQQRRLDEEKQASDRAFQLRAEERKKQNEQYEKGAAEKALQREIEMLTRKLADVRVGKPDSRATVAQKEVANRFNIIHAVDSTKKEIGDAMEVKLKELQKSLQQMK